MSSQETPELVRSVLEFPQFQLQFNFHGAESPFFPKDSISLQLFGSTFKNVNFFEKYGFQKTSNTKCESRHLVITVENKSKRERMIIVFQLKISKTFKRRNLLAIRIMTNKEQFNKVKKVYKIRDRITVKEIEETMKKAIEKNDDFMREIMKEMK